MNELISLPKIGINVRLGEMRDVPFMDRLQRMHTKQVGFFPTKQFEGNVQQGKVLIAEEQRSEVRDQKSDGAILDSSSLTSDLRPLTSPTPVGYCIASDRYFKHDDVGIIYQMNVLPGRQRGLIGASLLKAQFERSAYGCKLYCCWCAQDIAANKFWEAMGFVALAFRTGGRGTKASGARTHIFWQKRIRSGDTTTPWWFPSETAGGAVRENRLVLPIPPGTHWSDAKPLVLPGGDSAEVKVLSAESKTKRTRKTQHSAPSTQHLNQIVTGGLRFTASLPGGQSEPAKKEKAPRVKTPRVKVKNDPKLVAAARELRDRWLEQVNAGLYLPESVGKYNVCRSLQGAEQMAPPLMIEQAA